MFLALLVYLGWGRCGLLGKGSDVVELGEELVLRDYPRDLGVRGERGMLCLLGWMDLVLGEKWDPVRLRLGTDLSRSCGCTGLCLLVCVGCFTPVCF